MHERLIHLKIKIKSLAVEAGIIRAEENRALGRRPERLVTAGAPVGPSNKKLRFRWKRKEGHEPDLPTYRGLRAHRRGTVAEAARAALLAYGFLRGRAYAEMEPRTFDPPDFGEVRKVADRFALVQVSREVAVKATYRPEWAAAYEAQDVAFTAWLDAAKAHLASAPPVSAAAK